jgi:hypothetical protein
MGRRVNSATQRTIGWITFAIMAVAAAGLLIV